MDRLTNRKTLATLAIGIIILGGLTYAGYRSIKGSEAVIHSPVSFPIPKPTDPATGSWPALENADFFAQTKSRFLAEKASFVEADLSAMVLRVYKEGNVMKEVPILTKGREGSWWETPAGLYRIELKKRNHFSSFGEVYQPWSMAFQGNFFIHGWPYYPNGKDVSSEFSGGCIRLSTEDAKEVYDLVEVGTPVLVFEKDFVGDAREYPKKPLNVNIGAPEYLAADLKNNFVFGAREMAKPVPIASITKLMTALIAAEYINLDKNVTVPQSAQVYTSLPRLKAGERVSAYQLLYPLLAESSNEAAYTFASVLGRDRFVELMNKKAAALGMRSTHFEDAAGIGPGNVSTAEDLFLLAKYLLNNRSFILKISSDTLGWNVYGDSEFKDLKNFNIFTGEEDFVGGKVGKTEEAGQTMLAIFNVKLQGEERPLVVIVLGSADKALEARALKDTVVNTYQ